MLEKVLNFYEFYGYYINDSCNERRNEYKDLPQRILYKKHGMTLNANH